MLELARLEHLVDAVVDAAVIRTRALRSRPFPDTLVTACGLLGVAPADTVALTHSGAGVAAARAAGMTVCGIAGGQQAERLRGLGAAVIAPSLLALLDRSLCA
jgi:sugar-phosphatase